MTDMETCYKMFRTSTIQNIELKEKRFGFEPETTIKLSKIKGTKISECPISYEARDKKDGKKIRLDPQVRYLSIFGNWWWTYMYNYLPGSYYPREEYLQ